MGNSRSKRPSVRVLLDSGDEEEDSIRSFDTPRPRYGNVVTPTYQKQPPVNKGRFQDDDSDDVFSRKKRMRCPQCHTMADFKVAFYNDNSACSDCMTKLRKGEPIKTRQKVINFGGQQKDMRFPQNVAWDFNEPKSEKPKLKRKQKQELNDKQFDLKLASFTGNEFQAVVDATNKKFKPKPLPATNRLVLDKIAEKQPIDEEDVYVTDDEVHK